MDEIQEDLATAKDDLNDLCNTAWDFLMTTSSVDSGIDILEQQVKKMSLHTLECLKNASLHRQMR